MGKGCEQGKDTLKAGSEAVTRRKAGDSVATWPKLWQRFSESILRCADLLIQ